MNLTKKLKSNSTAGDRTVNRERLFVCLFFSQCTSLYAEENNYMESVSLVMQVGQNVIGSGGDGSKCLEGGITHIFGFLIPSIISGSEEKWIKWFLN